MQKGIFITGTDTGVGKTIVAGLLGRSLKEKGINVITQKWVQTGCIDVSEDISMHAKLMDTDMAILKEYYSDMVPYIFKFPSSPHLAASLEQKSIDSAKIKNSFQRLSEDFDYVIVEGSGGMLVPLNEEETIIDIAAELGLEILVVVGNRLGVINQTLLTIEALKRRNMKIAGLIFNHPSKGGDEVILKDNIEIIKRITGEKVLGEVPYGKDYNSLRKAFNVLSIKS